VTNLAAGVYSVCFEPKSNVGGRSITGYLPGCYHQQPYGNSGHTTPVTVKAGALTSRVDDKLAVSGAVSGRITGPDGSPVGGVLISTTSYFPQQSFAVVSAADGSYLMKNLPANGYTFCYGTDQATGSSTGGYLPGCDFAAAVYVSAGQLSTADHALDIGGIVTGVVRDLAGRPMAGVPVLNFNTFDPAVTDASGRYRVTGLYSGTYYFCVDGSSLPISTAAPYGYLNGCGYLPGVPVDVQVNQTATLDFTLSRFGALGGTLTRSDGTPAANASVQLFTSEGYYYDFLQTDAQGRWQQRAIPGHQYYACYWLYDTTDVWTCHRGQPWTGGQPTGDLISVSEGVLTSVDDALLPGANLTGTVTDPGGAAFANVVVNVDDLDGNRHVQAVTDSDGHYSVTGLTAGTYRVCFSASTPPGSPGYPYQCHGGTPADQHPYAVALATGQHATVDAALSLGTAITGRVTDAEGNPVQSVTVRLTNLAGAGGSPLPGYTDGDGNYTFYQLFPGDYSVCFDPQTVYSQPPTGYVPGCWHDQAPNRPGDPVHAVAGVISSGIDATLATGGQITGAVTDAAGDPVGGIIVHARYSDGTVVTTGYTDWQDGSYQLTALPALPIAVCFDPNGQPYQPACYANATDYHTATLTTAGPGATVSGIDMRLAESTAALSTR
jgi:hypothetical protein